MKYISSEQQKKEDELKFYRDMRRSNECLCGRGKQPGMWFCFRCYKQLPVEIQRELFGAMTQDMIDAYELAAKYLND